jgi:hypothetical protein
MLSTASTTPRSTSRRPPERPAPPVGASTVCRGARAGGLGLVAYFGPSFIRPTEWTFTASGVTSSTRSVAGTFFPRQAIRRPSSIAYRCNRASGYRGSWCNGRCTSSCPRPFGRYANMRRNWPQQNRHHMHRRHVIPTRRPRVRHRRRSFHRTSSSFELLLPELLSPAGCLGNAHGRLLLGRQCLEVTSIDVHPISSASS